MPLVSNALVPLADVKTEALVDALADTSSYGGRDTG